MAQIVGTQSNIFRCNLLAIQSGGSQANTILAADEVWLIDTTNSLTNSLSGNCDAYIVGDGTKAASALEVKRIDGELERRIDALSEEASSFEGIKELLDIDVEENEASIIDYTPIAGSSPVSGYWANFGSKTTPNRDGSGILSRIVVTTAPNSDTSFSIRLYRKVWSGGEITSFTPIPDTEHSFIMPSGQTSLNVEDENIVIEPDVAIFINGLAKYNLAGSGTPALDGAFQTQFAGRFNLDVNYFVKFSKYTSELINGIENDVNTVEKELDIQMVDVLTSIVDYKPLGTMALQGSNYWAAINDKYTPNRSQSGVLQTIQFLTAPTSDTAFSIKLYKITRNADGEMNGFTYINNSLYNFTMPANQTTLDVSSQGIIIDGDVQIFINGLAKFATTSTCHAARDGEFITAYDGGFGLNVNYFIKYSELQSVRLNSIEEQLPSVGVFADLQDANVVCLGDSITWLGGDDCDGRQTPSQGWTTYFKAMLKPKTMRSYARSGATWSHTANTTYNITEDTGVLSDDNVIYNQINRLLADTTQPTPDIIIIAAGTNDAWYPTQRPDAVSVSAADEFADTSGYITSQAVNTLTSIAAAMRYDIEMLKTNYPNAQIFVTTPLQSTKFTLAKCFQVGTIIKECAEYLSIECIDQGKQAGIYRAQEIVGYTFTHDGAHTSVLGARMVGQFILKKVLCNYRDLIAST